MQSMGGALDKTLQRAAKYDDLPEHEAVMMMTVDFMRMQAADLTVPIVAAVLAIRWHRTRATEPIVNTPGAER